MAFIHKDIKIPSYKINRDYDKFGQILGQLSWASETLHMTSEGLGAMFEVDICFFGGEGLSNFFKQTHTHWARTLFRFLCCLRERGKKEIIKKG